MFLSMIVTGLRNPKDKLDLYLQTLITELEMFWEYGVQIYVILISDFSTYGMLSRWNTAGFLAY